MKELGEGKEKERRLDGWGGGKKGGGRGRVGRREEKEKGRGVGRVGGVEWRIERDIGEWGRKGEGEWGGRGDEGEWRGGNEG